MGRGGRNAIHLYNGEMKEGGGSDTLLHLIASSLVSDPPIADGRTSLQHRFIYIVLNLMWTPKDYLINLARKAEIKTAQNGLCRTLIKCEKRPYLTPEVGD